MSAEKTLRWLHLIELLQGHPGGLSVAQIHSRLRRDATVRPCTRRTIERDLEEMGRSGVIGLHNPGSDGEPTRWALRGNALGPGTLSPQGAATLKLALRYLGQLLPPSAVASLRHQEQQADRVLKLREITDPGRRPWTDKARLVPSGHPLVPPRIPDGVLEAAYEALASERRIRATYRKPGADRPSTRVYSVLGLIVRPPKIQLVVRTTQDPFVLNLHRIGRIDVLDERTDWPPDFDLDIWLATGQVDTWVGDVAEVVIETTLAMADHWRETPLAAEQRIAIDGDRAIVTARLRQTGALRGYLLGLGRQVRVLAPDSLRDWIRAEAAAVAGRSD
jgi:predicted DNA-binding transcriptional regulator YafY